MEWMLLHLVQILPEKMPASCASFWGTYLHCLVAEVKKLRRNNCTHLSVEGIPHCSLGSCMFISKAICQLDIPEDAVAVIYSSRSFTEITNTYAQ